MNYKTLVENIINSNSYLTLATTDGKKPWANAVFFAADNKYNLYFVSYNDSVHVTNILKNPNVGVTIFDSHLISEEAQGVQIEATCQRVLGDALFNAITVLYTKRFPNPEERATKDLSVERFSKLDTEGQVRHIYKIIPKHFYILEKAGQDKRLEVMLKSDRENL